MMVVMVVTLSFGDDLLCGESIGNASPQRGEAFGVGLQQDTDGASPAPVLAVYIELPFFIDL